jgi:hypothetical protein
MIRRLGLLGVILFLTLQSGNAQNFIKAEDLIKGNDYYLDGRLYIIQDGRIDSLLSRHIQLSRKYDGFDGYRIQIYRGSDRNARKEANEERSEFISLFADFDSYLKFDEPNLFKVKVGDYRTKHEALSDLIAIKKKFPNAYMVTDKINFPDLD